jgi:putative ABC transport system ATP-binding protein
MNVLQTRRLTKEHGAGASRVRAVDEVDLDVPEGQTLAVMGPSGCGKSTLLHLLGGLERPTAGEVWVGQRRTDSLSERALARLRRRSIGFVFQAFHLVDELSTAENVELPALLAGRSLREARRRADFLLDQVGLAATTDVLRIFAELRAAGQTLVIVTHDERVAATADRLISMRDGMFVDDTRLLDGTGRLAGLIGLEG